ncbi:uncharacterized protein ACWYII_029530 isoform 2-T2 [Salvelinus alpinus]
MKGVDFGINNMDTHQLSPFVTNASQCRQKCTEHYNCQYFTFVGKKAGIKDQNNRDLCFLMTSTGDMPVTIQYLEHATSGYSLKNCSGIITYSAKYYSLVLEEKNWTEAQEYCRQHYTNLSIIHTEEDWKAIQSSLDYLHYFNESKSWINAMEFCRSRGSKSNLVHITNQTVHADVTQLLANVELQCGEMWIGLERSIFEWSAPWLWTSSDVDKVVKYSEWHSCFPLNPINYHCDLH